MTDVKGKTALVTGGAMGMGKLLTERLLKAGAKVVIWDLNEEKLNEAREELASYGEVFSYSLDITDKDKVYETADKVKKEVGRIDILVNNAGIVKGGPFLELSDEDHRRTMEVNIMSLFWVTKAFLPEMMDRNEGHVVNIASAAGLTGVPGASSYSASKFAVVGWTDSIRLEAKKMGKKKVRFTTVCPSFVATGMFDGIKPPFFAPMLTTEEMVNKTMKGITRNKLLVMAPLIVNSVPLMKGLNVPFVTDFIGGVLGFHHSMDTWQGRK